MHYYFNTILNTGCQNMNHTMVGILLDTSVFSGHGYKLESGLLDRLKQFKDKPTYIVIPDVIRNELLSHLKKKAHSAKVNLEKSFREANDHLLLKENQNLNSIHDSIALCNVDEIVENRLKAFEEKCDAWLLKSQDFVSVGEVLDSYFNSTAPFSETGKKKNEFPDAIALLASEAFAKFKGIKLYAVSKDNDWKSFCDQSEYLEYYQELAVALDDLHAHTAPLTVKEQFKQLSSSNPVFLDELKEMIQNSFISDVQLDAHVSDEYPLDGEISDLDYHVYDTDIEDEIEVIEVISLEEMSFGIKATIHLDVSAAIDVYTYNPMIDDYSIIGTADSATLQAVPCSVIMNLSLPNQQLDDAEINSVELSYSTPYIEFDVRASEFMDDGC